MGRKQIDDRVRLTMLLRAINAHPWARSELIRSQSGLHDNEFRETVRLARRYRMVTPAVIRGLGQAPKRYGLTPAGAHRIGAAHSKLWVQSALLAALKLDYARALINRWFAAPGIVWALSPYLVPARGLRPTHPPSQSRSDLAALAYGSLRLDGLACVRLAAGQYLNVALIIDPGNLKAEWLTRQFRSAHAWRRRPEWRRDGQTYFPVMVVVTTDLKRLTQATQLWRETAHDGEWPGLLRLTTLDDMRADRWWNEQRQSTALWGGTVACARPSRQPEKAFAAWWGEPAADEVAANQPPATAGRGVYPAGQSTGLKADEVQRLVDIHQSISLHERELLDRIGQYPLITAVDLAVVLACTVRQVREGLHELKRHALVDIVSPNYGRVLTWTGLCLLAAQVGLPPTEYARLRGWPVRPTPGGPAYAAGWLDAVRVHNGLVLDFLVGLCRHGRARLSLARWDHVQCLFELPPRTQPGPAAAASQPLRSVAPDATALVRIRQSSGAAFDLAFWLEVDRDSNHGRDLAGKLARYYQLGGTWDGLAGNLPRLLILVERGGEARLQSLRRRLRALNERYRTQLDVRLTRADLLADEQGRLNPLKPAWRTVEDSTFASAFEG